ncbi:MaoC family dehydratase [Emcibacter nanhaiensis]|uniref:MaoC family dehydratase n=1 Tax=Emcibacter nanhaiensis TaxID=1505037 RepID=A0A501PN78_9PROT|nr:MaoC family dehydratase [Emcibacter nanhaiensis]TPD61893.1 MaoC family dehydratase [Emcibacter nanhaiensis]
MSELIKYYVEDLAVGQTASLEKTFTEQDIHHFAEVTGDCNPLHLDEDYAKTTLFKGRIAHGMLTAGLISAVLGTELPGPGAIYMSQNLKFRAPVRIGDRVKAQVTVEDVNVEKKRVKLHCVCTVGDDVVMEGEAMMMVPSRG